VRASDRACVRACVRAFARACVCACLRACVRACVRASVVSLTPFLPRKHRSTLLMLVSALVGGHKRIQDIYLHALDNDYRCNMLQHAAARCSSLQHTATHTTTHYTSTSLIAITRATHCNTLQYTAKYCNTLQHAATHCNTLHHPATHSNTPYQHTLDNEHG